MPRKAPRVLENWLAKRIKYLRQKEYLSIPDIVEELSEFGVMPEDVTQYGGEVPENRPPTKAEDAASKSLRKYSDQEIADHYKIDVKDVDKKKRTAYITLLSSRKGSNSAFYSATNKLRKEIERVFPDDYKQILYNGKTQASLERILDHPIFQEKLGRLSKKATKKGGLKLDKDTSRFVRNRDGVNALHELRKGMVKLFPRPDVKLLNKLEDIRSRGLSFQSEEVQKLIRQRGGKNFQSLRDRSNVYSWETRGGNDPNTGKPVGDKVPGSEKKVASLLFGDSDDLKAMRALADDLVRDQVRDYFRTGKLSPINHLDHIFAQGNPRIINGQLFGGSVDELGKFQGVGITGIQNLRKLLASKNMSFGHVLSPERIKLLEGLEFGDALSVEDTQKRLSSRTSPQARYDTKRRLEQLGRGKTPKPMWGGAAYSIPIGLAFAGLSDKGWSSQQFKDTVSNPWYWGNIFTGLDTPKFIKDYKQTLLDVESSDPRKKKLENIWT